MQVAIAIIRLQNYEKLQEWKWEKKSKGSKKDVTSQIANLLRKGKST